MNKFIIVIFTFILITHNLSAEIIKNINIEGNKRVSNETITLYGEIELNKAKEALVIHNSQTVVFLEVSGS